MNDRQLNRVLLIFGGVNPMEKKKQLRIPIDFTKKGELLLDGEKCEYSITSRSDITLVNMGEDTKYYLQYALFLGRKRIPFPIEMEMRLLCENYSKYNCDMQLFIPVLQKILNTFTEYKSN